MIILSESRRGTGISDIPDTPYGVCPACPEIEVPAGCRSLGVDRYEDGFDKQA